MQGGEYITDGADMQWRCTVRHNRPEEVPSGWGIVLHVNKGRLCRTAERLHPEDAEPSG
jgi:hypothetical protein